MILLPEPDLEDHDYELWGQNVRGDFYTKKKLIAYGRACAAEMRERCAKVCQAIADEAASEFGGYPEKAAFLGGKEVAAEQCTAAICALKDDE